MKKMKVVKSFLVIILSLFFFIAILLIIYNNIGNSSVTMNIKGLGTRFIILSYQSPSSQLFKLVPCINGRMNVKVSVDELYGAKIATLSKNSSSRANQIRFFIEPDDNIVIDGKVNSHSISYDVVEGNRLSLQYAELQKELSLLLVQEHELKMAYRKTRTLENKTLLNNIIRKDIPNRKLLFIREHPDYELSADLLNDMHFSHDTIIKYSNYLKDNVREHEFGVNLFKLIEGWDNTRLGKAAPTFSQKTIAGDYFSLDNLRGKYVVLDFWGSWCEGCVKDLPKMKMYYDKYKKEIEFVGIACYDSKSALESIVKKYQLQWDNILEDRKLRIISTQYGISIYPTKFIIDDKGRIIKKIIGEGNSFYQALDSIMQEKEVE